MWTNPITLEALERSIKYYTLLASSPDGLGWAYVAVGVTAILSAGGQLSTVLKGGDSEVLFDGGSAGQSLVGPDVPHADIQSCSLVSPMFSCRAFSLVRRPTLPKTKLIPSCPDHAHPPIDQGWYPSSPSRSRICRKGISK
jgi:hypothetical protein